MATIATYYFNGSDAAVTDPNNNWSNDANLTDGSTSTSASSPVANGSVSSNYLMVEGTNAPTAGATIIQVKARVYNGTIIFFSGSPVVNAAIYTNGLAELLGTVTANATGPGSYSVLTAPTGGWTWDKVKSLETKVYVTGLVDDAVTVAQIDIEVTYLSPVSFYDNFDDNYIDTTKWTAGFGNYAETGGQQVFTTSLGGGFNGIDTVGALSMTSSEVFVQLVNAGNQSLTSYEAYPLQVIKTADATNVVWWYLNQGNIRAYKKVSGTQTLVATTTYNSAVHKWLRISLVGTTYTWSYTTDPWKGWTVFATDSAGPTLTSCFLEPTCGSTTEASTTQMILDNLNVYPSNTAWLVA